MTVNYFIFPATDCIEKYMRDHWMYPLHTQLAERTGKSFNWHDAITRGEIEHELTEARSVFYFGHGCPDSLGEPVILDRGNVGTINGMLVAIACWSAAELGPASLEAGTQTFVGFDDDVTITDSTDIDSMVVENFLGLATGDESAGDIEPKFRTACAELQKKYFHGSGRSHDNAHLIGLSAQTMKYSFKVLGDSESRY